MLARSLRCECGLFDRWRPRSQPSRREGAFLPKSGSLPDLKSVKTVPPSLPNLGKASRWGTLWLQLRDGYNFAAARRDVTSALPSHSRQQSE